MVLGSNSEVSKSMKSSMPTRALGPLSSTSRERLSKEAPETLKAPQRKDFTTMRGYRQAMQKYKRYGNWASSE